MASATNGTTSVAYTYDSEGLRLTKATGDLVYHYYYADGKLVRIHLYKGATSWQIFDFFYDQNGHPYALNHKVGGVYTTYYYLTNLQGDVLGMVKADGTTVATYTYDPYGKPLTATGTFAATNPLRYRGYCYDTETGLYYLQSRYYDPTTARFLNADSFASTGQGILGNNMFAYCRNNPVVRIDINGTADKSIEEDNDDKESRSFGKDFLAHMARQRTNGHTFSVGFAVGSLWVDSGGGKTHCLSVDNSYNYAIQESASVSTGGGTGTSAGLIFTYTSADNVQDLAGSSTAYGGTICAVFGISLDYIQFSPPTKPEQKCWGISVSLLFGAGADIHRSDAYTTSSKSWNPFMALLDLLYPN